MLRPARLRSETGLSPRASASRSPAAFPLPGPPIWRVCLMPGTEVTFERDVEFDDFHGNGRRTIAARVARFRQVEKHQRHAHHDALEFPSGDIVMLTQLVPGQFATVLQLPAQPRTAEEAQEQTRIPVVA